MCTAGSVAIEDQEGSKRCYKRIKKIEVLLQKDWKDRSVAAKYWKDRSATTRDQEDRNFAVEDRSTATKGQEDRSAIGKDQEDRSATAKDQSTTKDPKIEVLLRRIERSKRCYKRIKWSCDAEDEDIEE